ncbi:MAG: FKBP-type peptidyl-prolyl cis-trans isomerase [Bacteroidota bacterium]|nr:FKBP-type peptidyl-prolyl cis-trans isomerase [Bacteroidota bacterium]
MKKIKIFIALGLLSSIAINCKNDDNKPVTFPIRDYSTQYNNEKIEIEEYLNTHYLQGVGIEAVVNKIPEGGTQTPLSQHPDLAYKIVNKHNIEYKLYYIPFNQGINQKPSTVDSVFVSYKGSKLDGTVFDYATNPMWLKLDEVIEGWTQMIPMFKTGNYNTTTSSFQDFGSMLLIIPSGLGYYNNPPSGSNVGSYSTLVFTVNLNTLRYRDHDKDGILSHLEVENIGDDPREYNTDGDALKNYMDIDDDNDSKITKFEITDGNGNIYPFEHIPTCPNGSLKKHLDPNCQ